MIRTFLSALALSALTAVPGMAQQGPLRIEITDGVVEPLPLAIPAFVPESGDAGQLASDIRAVIAADLVGTGLFREIDQGAFIQQIGSFDTPVSYPDWQAINAQGLIVGAVSSSGGTVSVKFRLHDIFSGQPLGEGLQLDGSAGEWRPAGVWYLAAFTGGGELLHRESPYLDEDGKPCCPIVLMTAYVDRENRRYGVVRSLISMQDEINARRSKLLHQLNSRQTVGVKGAVSVDAVKRELSKPDGHVEVDPAQAELAAEIGMRPFDIIPQSDQVAGQFSLLAESKGEIDMLGPNASLLGQLTGDQSGRAIMAQQRAGMAELAPIYDSLRDWTLRCYRAMWERIRQYWTDERWIRITDEQQSAAFLAVNVPVLDQYGFPVIDPMTGGPAVQNNLAAMDVDIILDEAPDSISLQHEEFEQLSQLAQAGLPIPPEVLIEASSIRNKRRILEMMQGAQQQQAQAAAMRAQAEGAQAEAKSMRDRAAAERDSATAQKISVETQQAVMIGQAASQPWGPAY